MLHYHYFVVYDIKDNIQAKSGDISLVLTFKIHHKYQGSQFWFLKVKTSIISSLNGCFPFIKCNHNTHRCYGGFPKVWGMPWLVYSLDNLKKAIQDTHIPVEVAPQSQNSIKSSRQSLSRLLIFSRSPLSLLFPKLGQGHQSPSPSLNPHSNLHPHRHIHRGINESPSLPLMGTGVSQNFFLLF